MSGVSCLSAVILSLGPASAELVRVADFETQDFSQVFREVQGKSASVEVTNEQVRAGKHALKAVLYTPDRRAEVTNRYGRGDLAGENWYGFGVFFPESLEPGGRFDIFAQFHDFHKSQPEWSKDKKAPTCFLLKPDGRLQFDLKFQQEPGVVGRKSFPMGDVERGKWTDFVLHIKWTHHPEGFVKLWKNGELIVDYTGPTYLDYGAENGPYFKMGIYKGSGKWPGPSPRVIYFDEFRMGDAGSNFAEVDPATPR